MPGTIRDFSFVLYYDPMLKDGVDASQVTSNRLIAKALPILWSATASTLGPSLLNLPKKLAYVPCKD